MLPFGEAERHLHNGDYAVGDDNRREWKLQCVRRQATRAEQREHQRHGERAIPDDQHRQLNGLIALSVGKHQIQPDRARIHHARNSGVYGAVNGTERGDRRGADQAQP